MRPAFNASEWVSVLKASKPIVSTGDKEQEERRAELQVDETRDMGMHWYFAFSFSSQLLIACVVKMTNSLLFSLLPREHFGPKTRRPLGRIGRHHK
jgi:hypothetical protein